MVKREVASTVAALEDRLDDCMQLQPRLEAHVRQEVDGLRSEYRADIGHLFNWDVWQERVLPKIAAESRAAVLQDDSWQDSILPKVTAAARAAVLEDLQSHPEKGVIGNLNAKLNAVISQMDSLCAQIQGLVDEPCKSHSAVCSDASGGGSGIRSGCMSVPTGGKSPSPVAAYKPQELPASPRQQGVVSVPQTASTRPPLQQLEGHPGTAAAASPQVQRRVSWAAGTTQSVHPQIGRTPVLLGSRVTVKCATTRHA